MPAAGYFGSWIPGFFFSKNVAKSFWGKAVKAWEAKNHELAGRYLGRMYGLAGLTADDDIMNLPASRWKKLFAFSKPQDVGWLKEIAVPDTGEEDRQSSGADLVEEVLKNGLAPQNVLILVAEAVDKRKKLYKFIKESTEIFKSLLKIYEKFTKIESNCTNIFTSALNFNVIGLSVISLKLGYTILFHLRFFSFCYP